MQRQPLTEAQMNAAMAHFHGLLTGAFSNNQTRGGRVVTKQPLTAAQLNIMLDYAAVEKLLNKAFDACLDAGSAHDERKESYLLMFITSRVDSLFKRACEREHQYEEEERRREAAEPSTPQPEEDESCKSNR